MNATLAKIAASLAFLVGAMAVFAGRQVMLILQTAYRNVAAVGSLRAMTIRMAV